MSDTQNEYNEAENDLQLMVAKFNDMHRKAKKFKQTIIVPQQNLIAKLFAQLKYEYGKVK